MILHAATIAAFFFVDQTQQAQCAVQYVQPVPEEWKWWFGALAPWVGPLLSGVVSIYVAWKLFHWQGEKDRKQWIRDQKKAEWRELLDAARECQFDLEIGLTERSILPSIGPKELLERLMKIAVILEDRVFIDRSILNPLISQYDSIIKNTIKLSRSIIGNYVFVEEVYSTHTENIRAMREAAKKDLGIKDR